jgi:hypothetical protein
MVVGSEMRLTNKQAEELFFEDPQCFRKPPGDFGVLYLLRRDIGSCIEAKNKILWPGAMAIFAGIDLLGKFLAGDDKGPVGERFRAFIAKYFPSIAPADHAVMYQLRNSLLHSFGLYSCDRRGTIYRFQLIYGGGSQLVERTGKGFRVDLALLHQAFGSAITQYHADLQADPALQAKFMAMFPNYGAIPISV